MKIIDAHTHFFPIYSDRLAWADAANEKFWKLLNGKRPDGKQSLQGFPTIEKFLQDMDLAGIERAVIQGWYWEHNATCKQQNLEISKILKKYPQRFSAFAAVNIADTKTALEIADSALELGFSGFGEIHDSVQGFSWDSQEFDIFARRAIELNLPICVHLTKREDRQYFGKTETDNLAILNTALKYPDLKFILAHWAGSEIFEGGYWNEKFAKCKNIYIDSAASPLLHSEDVWKKSCKMFCKTAVFGSDYPLRLYPKKFKQEEFVTIVNEALKNVPEELAESFFYKNIKNLGI